MSPALMRSISRMVDVLTERTRPVQPHANYWKELTHYRGSQTIQTLVHECGEVMPLNPPEYSRHSCGGYQSPSVWLDRFTA